MRAFCFKHNKMTVGFGGKRYDLELKCGCKVKRKDLHKHRVTQKTRYFLSDGREIVKIPSDEIRYKLR